VTLHSPRACDRAYRLFEFPPNSNGSSATGANRPPAKVPDSRTIREGCIRRRSNADPPAQYSSPPHPWRSRSSPPAPAAPPAAHRIPRSLTAPPPPPAPPTAPPRSTSRTRRSVASSLDSKVVRCTPSRTTRAAQHLLWRVRERLAAIHDQRQAGGRSRRACERAWDDQAQRRHGRGQLQRPPALLLRRRRQARRHERRRTESVRRQSGTSSPPPASEVRASASESND
jgi:hypothetical protein